MTLSRAYRSNVDFPEPGFPLIQSRPRSLATQLLYFGCRSSHSHVLSAAISISLNRLFISGKASDFRQSCDDCENFGVPRYLIIETFFNSGRNLIASKKRMPKKLTCVLTFLEAVRLTVWTSGAKHFDPFEYLAFYGFKAWILRRFKFGHILHYLFSMTLNPDSKSGIAL